MFIFKPIESQRHRRAMRDGVRKKVPIRFNYRDTLNNFISGLTCIRHGDVEYALQAKLKLTSNKTGISHTSFALSRTATSRPITYLVHVLDIFERDAVLDVLGEVFLVLGLVFLG